MEKVEGRASSGPVLLARSHSNFALSSPSTRGEETPSLTHTGAHEGSAPPHTLARTAAPLSGRGRTRHTHTQNNTFSAMQAPPEARRVAELEDQVASLRAQVCGERHGGRVRAEKCGPSRPPPSPTPPPRSSSAARPGVVVAFFFASRCRRRCRRLSVCLHFEPRPRHRLAPHSGAMEAQGRGIDLTADDASQARRRAAGPTRPFSFFAVNSHSRARSSLLSQHRPMPCPSTPSTRPWCVGR